MRTRTNSTRRLSRRLARFNRNVANPVVRLIAGWLPPLAIVLHCGRTTGRNFATPALAFRTPDGLVVGVLYGTISDWVRNVQASGGVQVNGEAPHAATVNRDSSAGTTGCDCCPASSADRFARSASTTFSG